MRQTLISVLLTAFALLSRNSPTLADCHVAWLSAGNDEQRLFASSLRQSGMVRDAASIDSAGLDWPGDLRIRLGGEGVPAYQADTQTIVLPCHCVT